MKYRNFNKRYSAMVGLNKLTDEIWYLVYNKVFIYPNPKASLNSPSRLVAKPRLKNLVCFTIYS